MKHGGSRWSRRLAMVLATIIALTLGIPSGQARPDGPNTFPLAALWELLTTRPAWAFDRPTTPVQARGGAVESPVAGDAQATRANGGNGHKPVKTPGTLDEWRLPDKGDVAEQPTAKATSYEHRIGVPLCPIGQSDSGNLFLMMDSSGVTYGGHESFLARIADDGYHALLTIWKRDPVLPLP